MDKVRYFTVSVLVIGSILLCNVALASNYYVDGNKGNDSNPGTLTKPWKTISKANNTLTAGDTVYLRSGIYTGTELINPANSGRANEYITYARYPNDPKWSVQVQGSYTAWIKGRSYIKIDGLYFSYSPSRWVELTTTNHIILQNCKFYNGYAYHAIRINSDCNYTKILYSVFPDAPRLPDSRATSWDDKVCTGPPYSDDPTCNSDTAPADYMRNYGNYFVVDGCQFGESTHNSIDNRGEYIVIQNNTFRNGFHSNIGVDGHKALIQNNIVLNAGFDKKSSPRYENRDHKNGGGIYVMASDSIVRNNIIENNDYGIYTGGKSTSVANNTKIYNNTLYNNWWQIFQSGNSDVDYSGITYKNNIIFNDSNLKHHVLANRTPPPTSYQIIADRADYSNNTKNLFVRNAWTPGATTFYFKNTSTNPKTLQQLFSLYGDEWNKNNIEVNPEFNNPANMSFSLKDSSPLIDAGTWLTTITSNTGTNQSSFVVKDAKYFFDGWGIPGEVGDVIMTEGGKKTTIKKIDYDTNTIYVTSPINVIHGEGLALAYTGLRPNIGAEDNTGNSNATVVRAPTGVTVKAY